MEYIIKKNIIFYYQFYLSFIKIINKFKNEIFQNATKLNIFILFLTTFFSVICDKYGRKTLMYVGSVGYIISLGLVSMAFLLEWKANLGA